MKVLFELESYRFNPKKEYSLELHLDDNTKVEGELTYSSVLGKMYGTFSTYIATNKVVDIYEAKLYIRDEDDKRIHFQEDDYKVRFIDFVYNPKKEKAEDLSESQKAGIEKAITKYADKIIKKYRIKKSAMKHLEIIVTLFEAYAIEKPKYAKIVEEANKVLREIIQENS